jgi:hypothetical protein
MFLLCPRFRHTKKTQESRGLEDHVDQMSPDVTSGSVDPNPKIFGSLDPENWGKIELKN